MARKSTKAKTTSSKKEEKVTAAVPETNAAETKKKTATRKSASKSEKAVKETKRTTAKKAETKKVDAKKVETKVETKKADTKKEDTKVKRAARAKAVKKADVNNTTHYFEIEGEQISTADIEERIREAYKADGHRIGNIKDVAVYYNFAERRAYYVVNGKPEDKFVEF